MTPSPPPPPILGLSSAELERTVADYFGAFPWRPSPHTVLSQWTTQQVFERFFLRHDR